jgi:hypothetical protein
VSFTRVNPGGWGTGDTFTHAQGNQLDIDHSLSLDKSTAGDTLSGVVNIASTGSVVANLPNGIVINGAGGFSANTAGAVQATQPNAITSTTAGGIGPGVAGGISDGGVAGGIKATVAGGITSTIAGGITSTIIGGISPGVAGGIRSSTAAGIISSVASGIQSTAAGGFALNGGTSDYLIYGSTRSKTVLETGAAMVNVVVAGWNTNGTLPYLSSTANSGTVQGLWPRQLLNGAANGAVLASITVRIVVAAHTGVPATAPTINLIRYALPNGSAPATSSMFSTGAQSFWPTTALGGIATPASGAAWTASGNIQSITFTPDTNITIDTSQYAYELQLVDEQGANALTGSNYACVIFAFTGIGNNAL